MAEGDLMWRYDAGIPLDSADVITDSNGTIYFGAAKSFAVNSRIIAINPDGTLKWEFYPPSGGEFYYITGLALSNDESVLFAVDAGSDVYAIYTADGSEKWKYGISYGDVETPGLSGIVVDANDNVYVGSWCCTEGLFSLDYAGNFRWDLGGKECLAGQAIGKNDTVVYYLDAIYGLRECRLSDGNINWVHQGISWYGWGSGIAIADDGTIYYGDDDYFYGINPDGTRKWSFSNGATSGATVKIGSNGNIWHAASSGNSKLIVVNPSGSEVWHYDTTWIGPGFAGIGLALDANDICYIGGYTNNLSAINSDGTFRWSYATGDNILSDITFSPSEDTVYFGSDDGYLYALEKLLPPAVPKGGSSALPIFAKMLGV